MDEIKGHLILLMGPMGSGKGTLVKYVQEKFPELEFAVSCTTREKRPYETEGIEYHFLSADSFTKKIEAGEFLEWAEFSGNRYGTLKSEIIDRLRNGAVVLNEIELQGIQQLLPLIPEEHRTLVYAEAGSWEALEARAIARAPISKEHLELRKERYNEEIKMKPYADVVVDNTDGKLESAQATITDVITQAFAKVT